MTIAFLINRYATRIYPVGTSLFIKEGYEAGGTADILYNNALINPYRNFFNEIYILKSYPLIQETVDELNFIVSFYLEGNFKTSEIYKPFPLDFKILNPESRKVIGKQFGFKITSERGFDLFHTEAPDQIGSFRFNDSIEFHEVNLVVIKDKRSDLASFYDQQFWMKVNDPFAVTRAYVNRLQTEWAEEGAAVINIDINGQLPEKEIDF